MAQVRKNHVSVMLVCRFNPSFASEGGFRAVPQKWGGFGLSPALPSPPWTPHSLFHLSLIHILRFGFVYWNLGFEYLQGWSLSWQDPAIPTAK